MKTAILLFASLAGLASAQPNIGDIQVLIYSGGGSYTSSFITPAAGGSFVFGPTGAPTVATMGAAVQSALDGKQPLVAAGTTSQYWRGDKTWQTLPVMDNASVLAAIGFTPYSATNPSAFITQSGARSAISLTTTGTSGAATYNSATGVLNVPQYTGGGTVSSLGVTSSNLTVAGSPVTTSGNIAVSLPNVGTAGTYSTVTTDAQGRVASGTAFSVASPARTIATVNTATGFQIDSARWAEVHYEFDMSAAASVAGTASATVYLETANTNSSTPADWTIIGKTSNGQSLGLAVGISVTQTTTQGITKKIEPGKWVRIRQAIVGTASATLSTIQEFKF